MAELNPHSVTVDGLTLGAYREQVQGTPDTQGDVCVKLTNSRCQCPACREYFNSTSALDRHRFGPGLARRCYTPAEMHARGYVKNPAGFWQMPMTPEHQHALRSKSGAASGDGFEPMTPEPPPVLSAEPTTD